LVRELASRARGEINRESIRKGKRLESSIRIEQDEGPAADGGLIQNAGAEIALQAGGAIVGGLLGSLLSGNSSGNSDDWN
jgi:hypothetical protein